MTEKKKFVHSYRPREAEEHFVDRLVEAKVSLKWFIDLGPGSGEECLRVQERWPAIRIIGLEPSPIGYDAAKVRWPEGQILLQVAGWDQDGTISLHKPFDLLHSTMFNGNAATLNFNPALSALSGETLEVPTRSLDSLDADYGPFDTVGVWADVEGSEYHVLRGAASLFARRAIVAVNVETRPQTRHLIAELLQNAGMKLLYVYLECETYRNEVWILDQKPPTSMNKDQT